MLILTVTISFTTGISIHSNPIITTSAKRAQRLARPAAAEGGVDSKSGLVRGEHFFPSYEATFASFLLSVFFCSFLFFVLLLVSCSFVCSFSFAI